MDKETSKRPRTLIIGQGGLDFTKIRQKSYPSGKAVAGIGSSIRKYIRGLRAKYTPHQGKQEKARRLRQLKRGIIKNV